MHTRGTPQTMQSLTSYGDVVAEVKSYLAERLSTLRAAGIADLAIDPGLGFAKNARQSFELLARLGELTHEGVPIVVGASRKSFIASVDGAPPAERLGGTIAACLAAVARGARVLRVHDVLAVRQALAVARLAEPARTEAPHA
jgi:dihydropteroate synthase